jgi:hypothetical protein
MDDDALGRIGSAASPLSGVSEGFGRLHLAVAVNGLSAASLTAVALYVVGLEPWLIVPLSGVPLLVMLVFWARTWRKLATPQGINSNEYHQLVDRLAQLQSLLSDRGAAVDEDARSALKQANMNAKRLAEDLKTPGSHWLSGHAYLDAWERMHRAEEAVVISAPRATARAVAVADIDRLTGSSIAQATSLQVRATIAAATLTDGTEPRSGPGAQSSEANARQDVRYVRNVINRYREEQWRALIGVRDTLITTTALLWVEIYATVVLLIAIGAPRPRVLTGALFFLAGGLVGLVSQLYSETGAGGAASVEDFGLSVARVYAIPALAGAVGLLGVVSVAALHLSVNGISLSPNAAGALGVDWNQVFDWQRNGIGFGVAAVLALAPDRLFDLLKNTKEIKAGLASSEASGAA